jgi:pimeloyl-ACP methyl ester carboxylesterase
MGEPMRSQRTRKPQRLSLISWLLWKFSRKESSGESRTGWQSGGTLLVNCSVARLARSTVALGSMSCRGIEVGFTTPALPDLDPATFGYADMRDMWNELPDTQKSHIRAAISDSSLNPELLFHETGASSLEEVMRPSDFPDEPIASLDDRTYLVVFDRPRDTYETDVLGLTTASDGPVKLRGWYIQGPGLRGVANKRALLMMWPGRGGELTNEAPNHLIHHVYAGFDILALDQRGHGVSEGKSSFDSVAMAEDTFEVLRQLETGDGLRTIGPDGMAREGNAAIGLLPETAESTPVVLWGASQGTLICSWALTKHATEDAYKDFSIKGYVSVAGDDIVATAADPTLFFFIGYYSTEIGFEGAVGEPSLVYRHMDEWPAYFQAKGLTDHYFPPEACVVGYNKARGLKQMILVPTGHGTEGYSRYIGSRALKFAVVAALRRKVWFRNVDHTTIEDEVCKALWLP